MRQPYWQLGKWPVKSSREMLTGWYRILVHKSSDWQRGIAWRRVLPKVALVATAIECAAC